MTSEPLPYDGQFTGAEIDAAILTVRTKTMQGQFDAADGNVNGPSFSFSNEKNSGLYRKTAGEFRFSINGGDALTFKRLTFSGATLTPVLGIGTNNPQRVLHCAFDTASIASQICLENINSSDNNGVGYTFRTTTVGTGGLPFFEMGLFRVRFYNHNMDIRESGFDFGFQTTATPGASATVFIQILGVSGVRTIRSDSGPLQLTTAGGGSNPDLILNATTGNVRVDRSMRFNTGVQCRLDDGSAAAPSLTFWSAANIGWYYSSSTEIRFSIAGTDAFTQGRYTQNSHVNQSMFGIGIAPTHPLTIGINSNVSLTTQVMLNSDTTDGNGVVISGRSNTTGVGASTNVQMCGFQMINQTHDHPTRAGKFQIFVSNGSATEFFEFLTGGVFRTQTGNLNIQTLGVNTSIIFAPNGTGQIQFPAGAVGTPSITYSGATGLGLYFPSTTMMRFVIAGADAMAFTRATAGGFTNQPYFGIGISTPLAPLHISANSSTGGGDLWFALDNTSTVDNSGQTISFRTTTTGTGATSFFQMASITAKTTVHNHATRTSVINIAWIDNTTTWVMALASNAVQPVSNNTMDIGTSAAGWRDTWISRNVVFNLLAGLRYVAGTGQRCGDATLAAGTVTVNNTSVTANTRVILSRKTQGAAPGFLSYTVSAATSFTITSSNAGDTGVISYELIEVV